MFESLLEQILQKFLGKFVEGLNSQNLKLGVWSGNVVIENVSIKPEVLEMFEIPICLKFSSIGKLSLTVPWSSLSSSPLEVFMERIFIIIGPKQQKDWKFFDYNTIMNKIEQIENYVKTCIQKFIEKEKSLLESSSGANNEQQQAGYFEKLKLRIIDNIQVTINSIHIRFENEGVQGLHSEMKYSWGITLDKIEIYTTDENWKRNFFDRTDEKNKDKPMNKLLKLCSLSLYWNSNDKQQLATQNKNEILVGLNNLITRTGQPAKTCELLSLNSEIKLIQKTKLDTYDSPEFILDIELKAINTNLQKQQLQEIIHLIDIFNVYHNKLMEKRRSATVISSTDKERHKADFLMLFEKVQMSANKNYKECLTNDEQQVYEDILTAEPIEEIFPWVKDVAKTVQKNQKLQEIEKKKIKDSQGWFGGWWGGGATQDVQVSQEEKNEWDKFFEKNFSEEALNVPSVLRPPDYVWFRLEFRLEGGSIALFNESADGDKEGIKFGFSTFKAELLQRGEKNMEFNLSIMEIDIDLLTTYKGTKNEIVINFLRKNELVVNKNEAFLNFKFEKYPLNHPKNEVKPDSQITLINRSAKIVYNPIAVKRIIDFFDVKLESDELKDAAWQQLEKLNDATKKNLSQVMKSQAILKLDILLASPYVIIPFKPNNDPSNECWMLNLGTLKVKTNEMVLSDSINIEDKIFDIYDIELSDFRMQHFNTFKNLIETYSSLENLNQPSDNRFTLIPDLSVKVSVSLLKSVVEEFVKDKTNITLKASISSINLNFSPQIYQKLLKITECLILDEGKEDVHMMETEKSKLMSNCKLLGNLWRRHHGTHKWEKYTSVLSGSYIYFYEKPKDLQASRFQYIKNSLVKKIDDASLGMTNSFEIENRYGKIYLACQTAKETEEWIKVINSCQDEVKLRKEAKKITKSQDANQAEISKLDPNKQKLHIEFELQSLTLSLFEEDQKTQWLKYQSNSFKVIVKQYPYNVTVNLLLKSLEITDPWREYLNPNLNHFLSCVKTEGNQVSLDNFLEFSLNYMDRKHPNYEKIDTDIQISLGTFQLNFKPDTLLKILSFVLPKKEENNTNQTAKPQLVSKETIEVKGNLDVVDPEIKTINVKLFLYDVSLSLVHRKNFLSVAELRISNTKILFQQKLQEMYLELELGNFQLIDLTNYPKTLYKESQYNEAKKRQLLGLEKTSKEENPPLISIKFSGFQEGNPKIKNNITSMAQIEVSSVRVDFVMQPIFRILDYVLVQILGVLTNPASFAQDKKEMPLIEKPIEEKKDNLVLIDEKNKEKILSSLDKTPNISLDITIIKPLICLKASPDSGEYLLVDLGVIKIKNDRTKVNRTNSKEIYCDFYRIWMTDMGLRMIRNQKVYEMSRPYHFNLEVEKPCFIDDYKKVYKEEEIDSSLVIRSRILPIILSLYKADYLLIMKILFANISYDDMMDRFHIHDYVDNKKKPKPEESALVDKEKKASILINFQLDMDSINLFIMNPLPNYEKYNCPLSKISLSNLRLIFLKDSNNFLRLEVYADKLKGKYYEYESFLKESSLFGELEPSKDLEQIKYFSLSSLDFLQVIGLSGNNEEFFIEKEKLNINHPSLVVFLDMKPSGDKDIEIILNEIKVNAHGGVLLSLSGFATMDNTVTPPEPIGKSFEEELLVLPENNIKKPEPSKMNIKIDINDLLVLISNPDNQRPLALKGDIGIILQMKGSKAIDDLIKEAEIERSKKKNNEIFNEYELNRVFHLDLNLKGIELFVCHYDEIDQARKRNILLPLNLNFAMNNYLAWTPNKLFLNKAKNQVLLQDKVVFRICYQDISNIKKIVDYQLSTLSKFQPPEEEKSKEVIKKSEETTKKFKNILGKVQKQVKQQRNQERLTIGLEKKKKMDKASKTELVLGGAQKKGDIMNLSDSDFNITTKGIELIIVNDAGDAFIPVIDINIDEDRIILKKNIIFMNLLSPFGISVDYFNPQVTKWEPIIEKAKFVVELTTNAFKNPHLELKINNKVEEERKIDGADPIEEMYIPLNINVSTQMLNVLMKTLNLMTHEQKVSEIGQRKDELKKEEKKEDEDVDNGEIEYVSPYSIKNETGYPIQISRMLPSNMLKSSEPKLYTLKNGETVNLQIESDRNSLFSSDTQSEMSKICLKVLETAINYEEIKGIDLSRVRSFRSNLQEFNENKEKKQKNPNSIYLVTAVSLDTVSNRRLITVSSPLILENQTQMDFNLKVLLNQEKNVELILPKNGWLPIPLDLIYFKVLFKSEDSNAWSKEYLLANMLKCKEDVAFEEMIGNNYYMFTPGTEIINGNKIYGKTLMKIQPPFFFKNCLPMDFDLKIKAPPFLANEKTKKLKPQEEFHDYQISTSGKVSISIRIAGFGWSNFEKLYAKNTDFCNKIKLPDGDGKSCTVNIHHIESFHGSKHFLFYLQGYILNETTYNLRFKGISSLKEEKKEKFPLAGQEKPLINEPRNKDLIIFSENVEGLEIYEKNSEKWVSKEIPLGTVGDTAVDFKTESGFVHLGINIKMLRVDASNILFTKVVSITPRYIFVNMLDKKMGIRQVGTDQCFVIVEKDREPYKWEDDKKPKKIYYTIITDNEAKEWEWSGEIDISAIGRANFLLRNKDKKTLKYMKAEIRSDQGLIYIIIDEYKKGLEPYYLDHSLESTFEVTVIQKASEEEKNRKYPPFLISKDPTPFCWDYPNDKKQIALHIKDPKGIYQEFSSENISIDKIDFKFLISLQPFNKHEFPEYNIQIVTTLENQSKKTTFKLYEKKKKTAKSNDKNTIDLEANKVEKKTINREVEITCRLSHLGINIIQNYGGNTREILYITLRNLEFCLVDTKKTRTLQAKIRYFNIDNNHAYLVNFPVLFTPSEYNKIYKEGKYFMNVFIEKSLKHEEINSYKAVQIELEPFSIKVEDTLISVIIEFYTELAAVLWPPSAENSNNPTNYLYNLDKNKRPDLWFWEIDEIPETNQQTFIDEFILSPIKMNLTFLRKTKGAEINSGLAVVTMFFNALGVALANIDNAPIKLNGMKLENCFDTSGGITSKLISHYKANLTTEVLKLLGSINILGNPVGLFSSIGTGVQDLLEKPREGFIKGPLEGGIGLAKGAGSLLRHTLAGTFNSLDKITGSLGTGIAALSLDDEYLAEREKMKMVKAKHVGEGLTQAGMSIFTGFEQGIKGVFMKPIEGASKGGIKGFFKGTFQGISGLIVKPVSGLLDAASKTAEGIKNTATSSDDKPKETRERLLRTFYTNERFYKSFDKDDAEMNYFLQVELKKGRFTGTKFYYGHVFKDNMVLFITFEYFIYFDKKALKKKWIINTGFLKTVDLDGKKIKLELKYVANKKQSLVQLLSIEEEEIRNVVYRYMKEIHEIRGSEHN